ncbi:putative reverse transcriptase zinc-binding domain-containing protein [Helianthus annuus]|nr:putative reverse transcriptase zinc-binding domain-containing protein [Helianthus annuus]
MVWRIIQDRLPTKMASTRRNISLPNVRCILFDEVEETTLHLFVSCRVTNQVWHFVASRIKLMHNKPHLHSRTY